MAYSFLSWWLIVQASNLLLIKGDFLIDQRLKEEIRQRPQVNQFSNTLYDKSFYYGGPQRPVYNVIIIDYFLKIRFR